VSDLPERVRTGSLAAPVVEPAALGVGLARAEISTLEAMERVLIARALEATDGNQNRAAGLLAVERRRLYRKVAKYNLKHLTNGAAEDE
jgi:DNA-binding NtrC family response regulator